MLTELESVIARPEKLLGITHDSSPIVTPYRLWI